MAELTHEQFRQAWHNFKADPGNPAERMAKVIRERLGIDILLFQAFDVLVEHFAEPGKTYCDVDVLRRTVAASDDDFLVRLFEQFVQRHGGQKS